MSFTFAVVLVADVGHQAERVNRRFRTRLLDVRPYCSAVPRRQRIFRAGRGAGLLEWRSQQDLTRSLRRANWIAAGLAGIAALWFVTLVPPTDGETIVGGALLEALTLPLLAVAVVQRRNIRRRLRLVDDRERTEVAAIAEQLQHVDEDLWTLGRLVDRLGEGPIAESGQAAVRAAESATIARRALVERRHELAQLEQRSASEPARAALRQSINACDVDMAALKAGLDELGASLGALLHESDREQQRAQLMRINETTERTAALATAFRELRTSRQPGLTAAGEVSCQPSSLRPEDAE